MSIAQDQLGGLNASGQDALAATLHSLARFLRTVRHRSGIMLLTIVVAGILGAAYYVTAPRIYQSSASLYIVQIGTGVTQDATWGSDPSRSMPTFRSLMTRDEVLMRTLERLPERFRKEGFDGMSDAAAAAAIRGSLSVGSEFNTNVMDVSYRSQHPRVAAAVVASLLSAYESFMNDVNKGSADQNMKALKKQLHELSEDVEEYRELRASITASASDFIGVSNDGSAVNLAAERVKNLTSLHTEAVTMREVAESRLSQLRVALQNGTDLLRFTEDINGLMLEEILGVGTGPAMQAARENEALINLQSELKVALSKYGPNHKIVLGLQAQIETIRSFRSGNSASRIQSTEQNSRDFLGPRLLKMFEQAYTDARQAESDLARQLQEEKVKASELNMKLLHLAEIDKEIERLNQFRYSTNERMNEIDLNSDTFIRTEVATHPRVPKAPVSPRLVVVGFLSMFLGCGAGLGIIWVLDILDDRFRSPEELNCS